LIGVHDHPSGTFDLAGGSGHTFELAGVAVVTGQPLVDLFGGDTPEHAGKRFGNGLRRGVQCRSRTGSLERVNDFAATLNFLWPLHRTDRRIGPHTVEHDDVEEDIADFVAVEVEHVIGGFPQAEVGQHGPQFADFAPEDAHGPVFDVEVVVLHVRVGGDGQLTLGFKYGLSFFIEQVAVFFNDPLFFGNETLGWAHD